MRPHRTIFLNAQEINAILIDVVEILDLVITAASSDKASQKKLTIMITLTPIYFRNTVWSKFCFYIVNPANSVGFEKRMEKLEIEYNKSCCLFIIRLSFLAS